jgi:dipeptidyl aminopeptidase/acylaminoacyl peptidase
VALIVLLSACTSKAPITETVPEDVPPEAETAARQAVSDLISGNYAAVTARFDETMTKSLSVDKLQEAWKSSVAQAGDFAEISSAESFSQDGYYVCLVTTRHAIKGIVSRIVYDKDMKIAGLFFSYAENETELTETEMSVTIGTEYPLDGVLALPIGDERVPAVVLVHGSGPSDKDESVYGIRVFKDISDYLVTNGIAVLRYDKRTHAHAAKLSPDITVAEETIEDAILAGRLLAQNERVDSAKIFVVGHSLGGLLAPRIVDESNGVFDGAVIMAGSPRSFLDIIYDQNMYFISLADESERDALTRQVEDAKPYFGLPQGYIDEMDAHPASGYLVTTDKPYLILQGGKDFQVSPDKDFGAYKRLVGDRSNFEFRLYGNLNHLFTVSTMENPTTDDYIAGTHVDEAPLGDIVKWIKAR